MAPKERAVFFISKNNIWRTGLNCLPERVTGATLSSLYFKGRNYGFNKVFGMWD